MSTFSFCGNIVSCPILKMEILLITFSMYNERTVDNFNSFPKILSFLQTHSDCDINKDIFEQVWV